MMAQQLLSRTNTNIKPSLDASWSVISLTLSWTYSEHVRIDADDFKIFTYSGIQSGYAYQAEPLAASIGGQYGELNQPPKFP